jgi:hypothetical protein
MGTLADRIGTSYDRKIVRARNGGRMFKYRLYLEAGSEVGEAAYTQHINVGETIWAAGTRQFRVIDIAPVDDEDSPYVGLLRVEAA